MLSNLIQKLTLLTALALVGLVGGIGTGLHSVFDCCHECHCSSGLCDACPVGLAGSTSKENSSNVNSTEDQCDCVFCDASIAIDLCSQPQKAMVQASKTQFKGIAQSVHDCAICQLLAHFHSTPTTAYQEFYAWDSRAVVTISLPATIPDTSLRLEPSRGPPA